MVRRHPPPGPPRVPDGLRVYAIGDVHGCDHLLAELHAAIGADIAGKKPGRSVVLHLGDYVDRGPGSARTLDLLIDPRLPADETLCLMGNHERAMLDFLDDARSGADWMEFGGRETLACYGIEYRPGLDREEALLHAQREIHARLPPRHRAFLEGLPLSRRIGDYFFVHAGIRPGISLDAQDPADLLWIRDGFLRSQADHGCVVVHGHSPTVVVDERANRIGIDTGAVWTGHLSCLVLEGAERRILQTG